MTKIISYAYFRNETDVSQNIEDKKLDNPIKRAQEMLRMLLGEDFYNEIVSQFPSSFSSDNQALYDPYIKQFIAWQAYEYWLVRANINETRSGIRVHTEENSQVASDKLMGELIRDAKQTTQYYKTLMVTFIEKEQSEDSSKYPLYDSSCKHESLGNGFSITAIRGRNNIYRKINRNININGD